MQGRREEKRINKGDLELFASAMGLQVALETN